ncbi:MAG: hypothetical protein H8E34_08715 [Bacteroidetes bacterium]|nr:hypothetical protein [Bacteroidota bacterium]MBL6944288.1 hypothetical protein [Bacteroidales bacterium]
MRFISLLILALTTILLSSCKTPKITADAKENLIDFCESMSFTNQPLNNITTDYYTIDTLFITNNCLNLWVSYSGGCGDADFKLYYTNWVIESIPPKTSILLQLIDNDPCRAIVQQKLFFNLSFFDEYSNKEGIVLNLAVRDRSLLFKN